MQFMVIRKADAETEAGVMPSKQLIDDMTSYNEKLVKAGAMKQGAGLLASRHGARVSFTNGRPTVIDGPFTEAKEVVGGYAMLEAASMDEALELTRRFLAVHGDAWEIECELRQVDEGCSGAA